MNAWLDNCVRKMAESPKRCESYINAASEFINDDDEPQEEKAPEAVSDSEYLVIGDWSDED